VSEVASKSFRLAKFRFALSPLETIGLRPLRALPSEGHLGELIIEIGKLLNALINALRRKTSREPLAASR
jgi:hypothetical protein